MGSQHAMFLISPSKGWRSFNAREVWEYRELLYILVWRDLKVRYRQTLLGASWVMLQPLLGMLLLTALFHHVAKMRAPGGMPYSLFVLAGLIPWNFFAGAVQSSGNSLVGNAHLISKVYFPRVLVPLAAALGGVVDACVAFLLVVALMAWHGARVTESVLLFPLAMILALGIATGVGLTLSALNVLYRDVRVAVPFVLQLWMWGTPVAYPADAIPERYRSLIRMNPMSGAVDLFRSALFGTPLEVTGLVWSITFAVISLATGALVFRRMEREFADVI